MAQFVWEPTEEIIKGSNVYRFMRGHDIGSFEGLLQKSRDDIGWFWDAVVKFLGIPFSAPYEKVYDDAEGIEWTKWFVGGKTNLYTICVERFAQATPDAPAVIFEGEDGSTQTLTYRQLHAKCEALATGILSLGLKEGDRVGLYMPMVPETVVVMMACAKMGIIYLPIFSGFGPPAVASRLQDAEAKAIFCADGFTRRAKPVDMLGVAMQAVAESPTVAHVIVMPRLQEKVEGEKIVSLFDLMRKGEGQKTRQLDSEAPLFIAYTSGTTGRPKGAVHVHAGFGVKIAQEAAFQTDIHADDRLFWVSDMGWIMGPWETIGALANGASVFLYDGAPDYPDPSRLWQMIERHRLTAIGVSPTLVRALQKHGDEPIEKHDLSSLRIIGSTGEPWNPEPYLWFFERVGKKRCPIINLSGGTEVGACFLSVHPVQKIKPCSLGGPALGMDVDVYDESGKPVRGEVGELVCKKPWPGMTRGIWGDPQRYLETYWSRWKGVWVHGDWASVDEDGCWFLHGRSDDTIKIAGKRLGPAEAESALVQHDAVIEAAAIGLPDPVKGESLVLFAVLRPGVEGSEELEKELRDFVAGILGKAFSPKAIRFVDELPKTRSAKILRRAIRGAVTGKEVGDLSSLENPSSLEKIKSLAGTL